MGERRARARVIPDEKKLLSQTRRVGFSFQGVSRSAPGRRGVCVDPHVHRARKGPSVRAAVTVIRRSGRGGMMNVAAKTPERK